MHVRCNTDEDQGDVEKATKDIERCWFIHFFRIFFIRDGQKKGILSFPPNFYPFFIVIVPKKEDRLRIKQGLYKKISLAEVL